RPGRALQGPPTGQNSPARCPPNATKAPALLLLEPMCTFPKCLRGKRSRNRILQIPPGTRTLRKCTFLPTWPPPLGVASMASPAAALTAALDLQDPPMRHSARPADQVTLLLDAVPVRPGAPVRLPRERMCTFHR